MKTLNQLVAAYTHCLQQGEIQPAYKGILGFIGKLRADIIKKYPEYAGYMDMTYFPVITALLRAYRLKVAVVYLHEKNTFEAWLSAQNRTVSRTLSSLGTLRDASCTLFHDETNPDAILECTLSLTPNFDEPALLANDILQGVERFLAVIEHHLQEPI
jgi:hypothetical protein